MSVVRVRASGRFLWGRHHTRPDDRQRTKAARPHRERVRELTMGALSRILAAGKPAGILSRDLALLDAHLAGGASFVAVGIDAFALADAARGLLDRFRQ